MNPTPSPKERELKLFELRAKWTIAQQRAAQLESAINALVDPKLPDAVAIDLAERIAGANIGP